MSADSVATIMIILFFLASAFVFIGGLGFMIGCITLSRTTQRDINDIVEGIQELVFERRYQLDRSRSTCAPLR